MPKHHSEDYKITAVKHYVNKSKNLSKTCKIFECSRISLKRWVNRYKKDKSIKRYIRKPVSYKITNEQVKYALTLLKQNEQITMFELAKLVKQKYKLLEKIIHLDIFLSICNLYYLNKLFLDKINYYLGKINYYL